MTRLNYNFAYAFRRRPHFSGTCRFRGPEFLHRHQFPLVKGDPSRVFGDPQSVVLSESVARKYFGDPDPMGKIIRTTADCLVTDTECLAKLVPLRVTGVMRDMPHNSHLDGDVFIPNTSITDRISRP